MVLLFHCRIRWKGFISGKEAIRISGKTYYEFVLSEHDKETLHDYSSLQTMFKSMAGRHSFDITNVSEVYRQKLTHQTIVGQFINVSISDPVFLQDKYESVSKDDISNYPFSKK